MEERIKELEAEVHALNAVLFTAIAWLHNEFGMSGIVQLEEIYDEKKARKIAGIE